MTLFVHPAKDDISLPGILGALADPTRLEIVRRLYEQRTSKQALNCMSCVEAAAHDIPKSTLSHHFRILREAGLIRTIKQGVENRNALRLEELNDRFPGLLKAILKQVEGA